MRCSSAKIFWRITCVDDTLFAGLKSSFSRLEQVTSMVGMVTVG
ncbi:MAG: hypothetical protein WCL46_02835 [Chlorobium sp.]